MKRTFHAIFGVGDPTARQGNLTLCLISAVDVAVNVSSKEAILAGTLSLGVAMTLFVFWLSPKIVLAVTQNSYGLFISRPNSSKIVLFDDTFSSVGSVFLPFSLQYTVYCDRIPFIWVGGRHDTKIVPVPCTKTLTLVGASGAVKWSENSLIFFFLVSYQILGRIQPQRTILTRLAMNWRA